MEQPIRVLQVIGSMNRGGAENFIMNIYRNIDRSKVQFDFLVCSKQKAAFDNEIEALGGKIYRDIDYLNSKNILKYQSLCDDFFKNHNYKIVHCHIGSVAQFVLRAAKKNGAITVSHSHMAAADLKSKILYIPITKHSDYLFACSKGAAISRYGKKVLENNNCKVINNAIDINKFSFDESLRDSIRKNLSVENNFVIGHIGRFHEQKNHSFIIDIFNEVLLINKNAKLVLAGKGDLESDIKSKVDEFGISDKVIFLGLVDNPEEVLNAFDLLLFPSLYEGLPVSVVEAQANGLRCLLSDTVSPDTKITDLVEFYSLENSASRWAEKVLSYSDYSHKDTSEQIRKSGYDARELAKELEKFYLNL